MNALVVRNDKSTETKNVTHAEAVELSKLDEIAAVVSVAELFGGNRAVYIGGSMATYDPVTGEITGAHDKMHRHTGYVS